MTLRTLVELCGEFGLEGDLFELLATLREQLVFEARKGTEERGSLQRSSNALARHLELITRLEEDK